MRNCWEFMECGREPGGARVDERGVCPAALPSIHDGTNGGTCAGRYCWRVAGTLCRGQVQGLFAAKLRDCVDCPFYTLVLSEQGAYLTA